ncbi:MAG: Appr-1-p processing protein [Oligoflexia bacterium]|nr:Appr-1-p processing protein [Oligoflexia bacterium]
MQVQDIFGDITEQHDVDAIVNAWNRNVIPWWLLIPQGVSGAIKRRAGYRPFMELGYRPIQLGQARLTSAGKLPNKAIIHVAGINLLWTASEESIRASTLNALRLALGEGFRSIAMPVIGAGSGRFDQESAAELILDTLRGASKHLSVPQTFVVRLVRFG